MTGEIHVTQKAGLASDTTNIAVQNNYGIDAEKAAQLAINLFMENFPKLQEEARRIAKNRAEELCKEVIEKLEDSGKTDYREFSDPDVQYIFYEAQKGYARFGEKETLSLLGDLLSKRVIDNDNGYTKKVLDKAIEIALLLSPEEIDYLSFVFLTKHIVFNDINDVDDLKGLCEEICRCIKVDESIWRRFSFLNMIGCFELHLGSAEKFLSEHYNLDEYEVKVMLPKQFEYIHGDYGLTVATKVIAIVNLNNNGVKIDLNSFLY